MDYGLINLWLRDHRRDGIVHNTVFRLHNLVLMFGKETKYDICKYILRMFYKELKVSLDENNKRIPGTITDERIREMLYILEQLIHDYYHMMRFRE